MRLKTVGRVAAWVGGVTFSAAVLLVLLYLPPGAEASDGLRLAERTVLVLLGPSFLWLSAFRLNLMLLGDHLDRDERLQMFGRDAVGVSVAAVAVGVFLIAFEHYNPLPPSCPHPARFVLTLPFVPAGALLAGLGVAKAWGLAARTVRVMNLWFNIKRRKLAFLIKLSDPELPDSDVACLARVSRTSLFRWPEYQRLKGHVDSRRRECRGLKPKDGLIDGLDENDEDDEDDGCEPVTPL